MPVSISYFDTTRLILVAPECAMAPPRIMIINVWNGNTKASAAVPS